MNKFNDLLDQYPKTNLKPDKKHSILPTVLRLLMPLEEKTVVDVGCGEGFFSRAIAEKNPIKVYGIDSSPLFIDKATKQTSSKIVYKVQDMFSSKLPMCDIINAPFVLNYATSIKDLKKLLNIFYDSLNSNGKLVLVVDLPLPMLDENQINKKRKFGATKKIKGNLVDGTNIRIELFNNGDYICTLNSNYFTKKSIERVLLDVGFKSISWHIPIIDKEGKLIYGKEFWEDYLELCELGYITAIK